MHHRILDQLDQDHHNISRVLALLRLQSDFLGPRDEQGLTLLRNAVNYLYQYPGLLHHPLEELIFDRVVAAEPSMADLAAKIKEEHVTGRRLEEELLACFIRLRQAGGDLRPELQALISRYLAYYREHMQAESAELLPLAGDLLQDRQWQEIEDKSPLSDDPIFYAQNLVRFENLYDALMNAGAALKY